MAIETSAVESAYYTVPRASSASSDPEVTRVAGLSRKEFARQAKFEKELGPKVLRLAAGLRQQKLVCEALAVQALFIIKKSTIIFLRI